MPTARPLSPHLQIYRWQLTMVLSIIHRATGVALAVGTTTEALQLIIPGRGATLLDLGANWLGIFIVAALLYLHQDSRRTAP